MLFRKLARDHLWVLWQGTLVFSQLGDNVQHACRQRAMRCITTGKARFVTKHADLCNGIDILHVMPVDHPATISVHPPECLLDQSAAVGIEIAADLPPEVKHAALTQFRNSTR